MRWFIWLIRAGKRYRSKQYAAVFPVQRHRIARVKPSDRQAYSRLQLGRHYHVRSRMATQRFSLFEGQQTSKRNVLFICYNQPVYTSIQSLQCPQLPANILVHVNINHYFLPRNFVQSGLFGLSISKCDVGTLDVCTGAGTLVFFFSTVFSKRSGFSFRG